MFTVAGLAAQAEQAVQQVLGLIPRLSPHVSVLLFAARFPSACLVRQDTGWQQMVQSFHGGAWSDAVEICVKYLQMVGCWLSSHFLISEEECISRETELMNAVVRYTKAIRR